MALLRQPDNSIFALLCDLKVCDPDLVEECYPRVRDRDDICVMRCKRSGVIFLSRSDHMGISHYERKPSFSYLRPTPDRSQAVRAGVEDGERRARQFRDLICNRRWLDVGTGAGGILDLVGPQALEVQAVEPQEAAREPLIKCGYVVHRRVDDAPLNHFDVVTLFHVFEHLTEPLGTLRSIHDRMVPGGKIVLEVPHANDFLISTLAQEEFKAFTFWSEHLILHTRQSITTFLSRAGFKDITVTGFQRYPLANHLHWLVKKKPGGHQTWSHLRTTELDAADRNMLASLDMTDTLIAIATK